MYYSFYEAEEPLYFRDISGIREELEEARRCLYRGNRALDTVEEVASRLSSALENGGDDRCVSLLDAVSETEEDLQKEASDLKIRIDALAEELEETLFWFRGNRSC